MNPLPDTSPGALPTLEEQLAIFVMTYRRPQALDHTLGRLAESPFAGCRITVLDNCSPDDTPAVVARHQERFPRLASIRHRLNLGVCPNYLRAVELSDAPYTWVLGDDETYDFSDCGDVLDAVRAGRFDLVSLGAAGETPWKPGVSATADELARDRSGFFLICSFVPSMIFRTDRFDSACMTQGFKNSVNLFPHFTFIEKLVRERATVYVARHRMISRDNNENDFGRLNYAVGWLHSCATLEDPALRRLVAREVIGNPGDLGFARQVAAWIAMDKIHCPERVRSDLRRFRRALPAAYLPAALPALPLALAPPAAYRAFHRWNRRRKGRAPARNGAAEPLDAFRS